MTDESAPEAKLPVQRKNNLFVKGQSGNPNGRPKGSVGALTAIKRQMDGEARKQLLPHMSGILQKAIEFALKGDPDMIKLLLDKCISVAKSADEDEAPREKIQIVIQRLDVSQASVVKTVLPLVSEQ